MSNQLGDKIREARNKLGLSARALSIKAGLSPSLIHHIETGYVSDPKQSTIVSIAGVLDVSIDWLLSVDP